MDRKMDIRIVNESGKPHETMVYGQDGQPLQYITRFAITGDWRNGTQAELWVRHPRHDIRVPDALAHISSARLDELEAGLQELRGLLHHDSECGMALYPETCTQCDCNYPDWIAAIDRLLGTPNAE